MISNICGCVEDESEFDYIKGSEKGPSHWGELKKEWETCKSGKMQSPIDLSSHRVRVVPKLGELKKYYTPQNATIKNRGHDIEVINQSLITISQNLNLNHMYSCKNIYALILFCVSNKNKGIERTLL